MSGFTTFDNWDGTVQEYEKTMDYGYNRINDIISDQDYDCRTHDVSYMESYKESLTSGNWD